MRRPVQRPGPSRSGDRPLRLAALALVAGPLACAHGVGRVDAPRAWTYTIEDQDEGTRWSVELCFTGPRPTALVARESAFDALLDARDAAGGALPIDREAGRIDLRGLTGPCLHYDVDLAAASFGWGREVVRGGDGARLVSTALWLWAPALHATDPSIEVRFATPPDVHVSAPWPRKEGAVATFTPATSVIRWDSYVAVGPPKRLRPLEVPVAGGILDVVMVGDAEISDDGVRRWLTAAGEAVAELYGELPAARIQVILVALGIRDDAVLFGAAERGGGPSIYLLIGADAPDEAFIGEWVSIHELLHLGMPPIQRADAWLPEGFVTYYTEVVRARTGLRTQTAALAALDHGFGRGRADIRGGTLGEASPRMGRTHAYSWVYWGGAAIAFVLDVALRDGGGPTLDDGLRHLHQCCARADRRWTANEVLAELDTWARSDQISSLVARVLATPGFDELATIYGKLGLSVVNATLVLDDDAPLAPVRRAIFARPRASAAALEGSRRDPL